MKRRGHTERVPKRGTLELCRDRNAHHGIPLAHASSSSPFKVSSLLSRGDERGPGLRAAQVAMAVSSCESCQRDHAESLASGYRQQSPCYAQWRGGRASRPLCVSFICAFACTCACEEICALEHVQVCPCVCVCVHTYVRAMCCAVMLVCTAHVCIHMCASTRHGVCVCVRT